MVKVEKVLSLINSWLDRTSANTKELQQILGNLHHCGKVVRSGRLHTNRMLDTLRRSYIIGQVPLDTAFRLDLLWWRDALVNWNGISTLIFSSHDNLICLDASSNAWESGKPGLGAFNFTDNTYWKCTVPDHLLDLHINDLELLAHIISIHFWGKDFCGQEILGKTDNQSCEFFLKFGKSRVDLRLRLSRSITHLEHSWGFKWIPAGIRSKDNILADCLSRWYETGMQAKFFARLASLGIHNARELSVVPHMFDLDFRCRDVPLRPH